MPSECLKYARRWCGWRYGAAELTTLRLHHRLISPITSTEARRNSFSKFFGAARCFWNITLYGPALVVPTLVVGLFCSNAATLPEFGGRDLGGGAGVIPTPLTFCERTFLPFEFVKKGVYHWTLPHCQSGYLYHVRPHMGCVLVLLFVCALIN